MSVIASEEIIFRSPAEKTTFCYTPALVKLPNGRLVATFDLLDSTIKVLPPKPENLPQPQRTNIGKIFLSDDNGKTWRQTGEFAMVHARPFVAGGRVYLIGHNGYLGIMASDDNGETWSPVSVLEETNRWHQSACAIDFRHGKVYLTMEITRSLNWPDFGIVLMSGKCDSDLTDPASWTYSNACYLPDLVGKEPQTNGVPFLPFGDLAPGRFSSHPGWLESHVMRIYDPDHYFYDPEDRTVLIFSRCHTGLPNIGTVIKGVEQPDGTLTLEKLTTPGGAPFVFVNIPGGHMKFFMLYDEESKLYWMASSQSVDSMTRVDRLPPERYGLPDNERHRLALYFSRNLFDWCFAGMVAVGKTPLCSRHYISMITAGEDLLILSRSGDENAASAHNGNLLTLHRVESFRKLVY